MLLPCNRGAKEGNYWRGKNWQVARKRLQPLADIVNVSFAAIDCIAVELGYDAIVEECEMERVKGNDKHPNESKVTHDELVEAVLKGWWKFSQYDLVLVRLNLIKYREAFLCALNITGDKDCFRVFDRLGRYYRNGMGKEAFRRFVLKARRELMP